MANFGEVFKSLRKEKNLTQKELVKIFNDKYHYNFTESAISQYENNKRIPEISALVDFSNFFNVSMDYLLGRTIIKEIKEVNENYIVNDSDIIDINLELNLLFDKLLQNKVLLDDKFLDKKQKNILVHSIKLILEFMK